MYQKPKEQAKAILKDHSPGRITLAYLLPTMGLSLLLNFLMPDFYGAMMSMDTQIMTNAITMNGGLGLFLSILVFYFGLLMSFGYKQWALRVARGEKPPLSSLIAGFGCSYHVLWLSMYKYASVYVFSLILFTGLMFLVSMILVLTQGALLLPSLPLLLGLATLGSFWIHLRYCLVELQLSDNLEAGPWDAMKQGVRRQRIAFDKLVKYYLSYWRWLLVYLATVFGYFVLNIVFGAQGMNLGELDVNTMTDLMATESAMAYWISTAVDWLFMLKFLPVFYVGLGVVFEEIKADEDTLMRNYHKGQQQGG